MIELLLQATGGEPLMFRAVKDLEAEEKGVHRGYTIGDILRVTAKGWAQNFKQVDAPHIKVCRVRGLSFDDPAVATLTEPLLDEKHQQIQRRRHCLDISKVPSWKWRRKVFTINGFRKMLIDKDNAGVGQ